MDDVTSKKVAVLCGGWSDEREVSLMSGRECSWALESAGFAKVDLLDIAAPEFVRTISEGDYDVAFLALHGRYGEDGCVQGFLELLGMPYTFSGVLASAVASDKAMAKDIYREHDIPTPASVCIFAGDAVDEDAILAKLGLPVFVKPVSSGSSHGISCVDEKSQFAGAIAEAFKFDTRVLIESAVTGTEVTVPVLGNNHPQALPAIEVRYETRFYDENVKYEDPSKHHVIPPELPAEVVARAQELACRAHVALGCMGASRSDFIIDEAGQPYIIESNLIPGMTPASLFPDAANRAGRSFPELCRYLVELALERGSRGESSKPRLQPVGEVSEC